MKMFQEVVTVYLHRDPVDFRKSINGLSMIVEAEMALSPLSGALFGLCHFCQRKMEKGRVDTCRDNVRLWATGGE